MRLRKVRVLLTQAENVGLVINLRVDSLVFPIRVHKDTTAADDIGLKNVVLMFYHSNSLPESDSEEEDEWRPELHSEFGGESLTNSVTTANSAAANGGGMSPEKDATGKGEVERPKRSDGDRSSDIVLSEKADKSQPTFAVQRERSQRGMLLPTNSFVKETLQEIDGLCTRDNSWAYNN